MPRRRRSFLPGHSYHITMRCNDRAYLLRLPACRRVLLYCARRARDRFGFRLYAVCVMSNHVHYLIEPAAPDDLPRIMHWLNWYAAMCLNRLLDRRGHLWEERYHAVPVPNRDRRAVLATLRYIHGNPKAAGLQMGFRNPFSNYGSYADGADDGLTTWHHQFLTLGNSLDDCSLRYAGICARYVPAPKPERPPFRWGSHLLATLLSSMPPRRRNPRHPTTSPSVAAEPTLFDRTGRSSSPERPGLNGRRRPDGARQSATLPRRHFPASYVALLLSIADDFARISRIIGRGRAND